MLMLLVRDHSVVMNPGCTLTSAGELFKTFKALTKQLNRNFHRYAIDCGTFKVPRVVYCIARAENH